MTETIVTVLLWLSALGCAVMAGLYFAFSAFIMRALGEIDRAAGIAAMIAINRVILRSAFMPVFLGSTLSSVALAVIALPRWGEPGAGGDDGTWALYLTVWTRWNHIRTLASAAGLVLFVVALIELGANG